ncbi:MAG: DUF4139 domain-containing protein [Candidatus Zixiibacteriota bacterium]|nr:MAG: DUF4139 domain-containing protein [candidate division Zixibacteria bacterium]
MKYLLIILFSIIAISVAGNEISVTVYNSDLGVISEKRNLNFTEGVDTLAYTNVPSRIDPASVRFELSNSSQDVTILEQNYLFDLVSPEQMYKKYIDKEIEILNEKGELYTGILLVASRDAITLEDKTGEIKIVMLSKISNVTFPSLPDGLITKPTLFWLYNSNIAGEKECQVSYQTRGMNWEAEYVGILDAKEKNLGLSGWASISNKSGKRYENASLKLIAGDINRATQRGNGMRLEKMSTMSAAPMAGFKEKAFFEYHLYTLPRKATLADKEIKQISLFDPASTIVSKEYLYFPDKGNNISVNLNFKNSKVNGLGMPLPSGRVRLFKADDDGSMILLGEDRISHTPKDEELKLKVGNAFDVKGEYKTISHNRISQSVIEEKYEIELRNHKDENITVRVEKKLYNDWEVLESNFEYEKEDASTIVFQIPVAKNGESKITLKVRLNNR